MTIEAAAPLLDFSPAKLSRIENARQGVDVHVVRSMLDLFDVGGEQWGKLLELTREASVKGWWRAYGLDDRGYLPLEAEASKVRTPAGAPRPARHAPRLRSRTPSPLALPVDGVRGQPGGA